MVVNPLASFESCDKIHFHWKVPLLTCSCHLNFHGLEVKRGGSKASACRSHPYDVSDLAVVIQTVGIVMGLRCIFNCAYRLPEADIAIEYATSSYAIDVELFVQGFVFEKGNSRVCERHRSDHVCEKLEPPSCLFCPSQRELRTSS
jgi:hypothetical protein